LPKAPRTTDGDAELRDRISAPGGAFGVGEHLRAQKPADRVGVPRAPVREAQQVLEADGYLQHEAARGFFVRHELPEAPPPDGDGDARPFDDPDDYQRIAEDRLTDKIVRM
jgi:DNA-binding FadR family transcriptional regulator